MQLKSNASASYTAFMRLDCVCFRPREHATATAPSTGGQQLAATEVGKAGPLRVTRVLQTT